MRLLFLDSLKFVGAYIVLFSHYYLAFNIERYNLLIFNEFSPFSLFVNGNWAVCLFIMLSSFSLVYTLEKNEVSYIRNMIIKRYFRLVIPIVSVLSVIYLLNQIGLFYNREASDLVNNDWLSNFYNNNIDIYDFFKECLYVVLTGKSELNSPLWMINYIFIGTFLVILINIAIRNISFKKKLLVLSCMSIYLLGISVYYFCIILGYILYCFYIIHNSIIEKNRVLYINILCTLGFVLFPLLIRSPLSNSISAFLLLVLVLLNEKIQQLLSNKYTTFLGRISYQLYLVHWPIICSISCFVFVSFFSVNALILNLIVFLLSVFIPSLLAWFITKYIEPFYNLLTNKIVSIIN